MTDRLELEAATKNVFNTIEGKRVLKYLKDKYFDMKIKEEHLTRQVGQRDVLLEIINLMKVRE